MCEVEPEVAIAVNEVCRQAQPLKDARLKGSIFVKVNEPAAKREVVLMTDEGPVAVGEIPAVGGSSKGTASKI